MTERLPGHTAAARIVPWLKPLALTAIFLLGLAMIVTQSYNPFLYFRF